MAFGKSLELRYMKFRRKFGPRPTVVRDRSLRGKDRIRARKAANKASKAAQ